jgi:hypothetical protein
VTVWGGWWVSWVLLAHTAVLATTSLQRTGTLLCMLCNFVAACVQVGLSATAWKFFYWLILYSLSLVGGGWGGACAAVVWGEGWLLSRFTHTVHAALYMSPAQRFVAVSAVHHACATFPL